MAIVKIKCINQAITIDNRPIIASGGLQENTMQFEFCSAWEGMTKTAVFYRNEKEVYNVLIDLNNECPIPDEVLQEAGTFFFGVYGVIGTRRKTSEIERYNIIKGSFIQGSLPSEPTPDIYSQLIESYSEIKEEYQEVKQDYNEVKNEYNNIFNNLESVVKNMTARGFINLNTNEGVVALWVGKRTEYEALNGNYIIGVKYFVEDEDFLVDKSNEVLKKINGINLEQIFEYSTRIDDEGTEHQEMTHVVKNATKSNTSNYATNSGKAQLLALDNTLELPQAKDEQDWSLFFFDGKDQRIVKTQYKKGLLFIEFGRYNNSGVLDKHMHHFFFDSEETIKYYFTIGDISFNFDISVDEEGYIVFSRNYVVNEIDMSFFANKQYVVGFE